MRQHIEDGIVTTSRAQGTITFPAKFTLIVAMNPCPCGYYGDAVKECTCSETMFSHYQKRISRAAPTPFRHPRRRAVGAVGVARRQASRERLDPNAWRVLTRRRTYIQESFEGTSLTCNADLCSATNSIGPHIGGSRQEAKGSIQ